MSTRLSPEARAFLQDHRFAVLATINRDGTPQQTVVWYELEGDEVVTNTRRGRVKDRNLRRDPRASFCVEAGYQSVTLSGHVTLIDDPTVAQADIKRLALLNHSPEETEQLMRDQYSQQERVTVRLRIEHIVLYGFPR